LSFLNDIQSGNVFGAMVRGPVAAPYSLTQLVAAGLVGFVSIDPIKSAEWVATGAVAFRARFVYTWALADAINPPVVLCAVLGSPPNKLLFAAPWSLPPGFPVSVGDTIAIPIFLTAEETNN
jgi:hypothetical protein